MNPIKVPNKYKPLYHPARWKVYYGGRGARKSWEFAQALVVKGAEKKMFIVCGRELQNSIDDSVHKLLCDTIQRLELSSFYTITDKHITGRNGSRFVFKGLKNNIKAIKSLEGCDILWVEEAENVSKKTWQIVIPTIRKPGSEIWVSFNPDDEMDDTYQRLVVNPPNDAVVIKVSWRDNPDFPDVLREEMEQCKKRNYKEYLHIWEGEPNMDFEDSIIQPEWFRAATDSHIKLGFEPRGLKVLGFDPADEGSDDKAYSYRHGSVVLDLHSWIDGNIDTAISKVFSYAYDNRINKLVYDSVGIGAGVKVGLNARLEGVDLEVEGFFGSERTRFPDMVYKDNRPNKDMFKNLRAQFYWYLRDRFEDTYLAVEEGKYKDPDKLISISSEIDCLKELRSEVTRIQRKRGQNNFIQIESKTDMLSRDMPSPNRADALMYCFANKPVRVARQDKRQPKIAIA